MRITRIILCLALLFCAGAAAVRAEDKADNSALLNKLNAYFENFLKVHPDPKYPGVHVALSDSGKIPGSPFSVFDLRFLDQAGQEIGKNRVITDGKYLFPGGIKIINLEDSKEIAQAYFTKISRVSLDPKRGFLVGGNPKADIKIVFFSDYECPYCKMFAQSVLPGLVSREDVAVYHYELPLTTIHHNAAYLADVAVAFRKVMDGKEVPADFYGKTPDQVPAYLDQIAGEKKEAVMKEAESEATKKTIQECEDLAKKLEINSTPTVLVNGYRANPSAVEINAMITQIQHKEL